MKMAPSTSSDGGDDITTDVPDDESAGCATSIPETLATASAGGCFRGLQYVPIAKGDDCTHRSFYYNMYSVFDHPPTPGDASASDYDVEV